MAMSALILRIGLIKVAMQVPVGTAQIICTPTLYEMQDLAPILYLSVQFQLLACVRWSPVRCAYLEMCSFRRDYLSERDR